MYRYAAIRTDRIVSVLFTAPCPSSAIIQTITVRPKLFCVVTQSPAAGGFYVHSQYILVALIGLS